MEVEHLNQIGREGRVRGGFWRNDLLAEPYIMLWIHQGKERRKGGQGNGKGAGGMQLEQRWGVRKGIWGDAKSTPVFLE